MRSIGALMIGAAVFMGAVGITQPDATRKPLMIAAGIFILVGLLILLVSAYLGGKKKNLMNQFQLQGLGGGAGSGFPGGSGLNDLDPQAILKSVMDAQSQAGGDPQQLASILQQQFGRDNSMTGDGKQIAFGSEAGPAGNDPISLLATLSDLRDKGVLTEAQFEEQKSRLLEP